MNYKLIFSDGSTATLRANFAFAPVAGKSYTVTAAGRTVSAHYIGDCAFVQQSLTTSSVSVGDLAAVLGFGALVLAIGGIVWWSIKSETGMRPDADVLAAAAQTGKQVQVSDSKYSQWSGCDARDTRFYSVTDAETGRQIAIVCQGSRWQLFGAPTKAPTLRYQAK